MNLRFLFLSLILLSLLLTSGAHAASNCNAVNEATLNEFSGWINEGKYLSKATLENLGSSANPKSRISDFSMLEFNSAIYAGLVILNDCPKLAARFDSKKLVLFRQKSIESLKSEIEKSDDLEISKSNAALAYLKILKNSFPADVLKGLEVKIREREAKAREACPRRDFESQLPPVVNQKAWGWCYAIAASTLASFKTGNPISTSDVVVNFQSDESLNYFNKLFEQRGQPNSTLIAIEKAKPEERLIAGGFTNIALKATLRKGGFCKLSDFPDNSFLDANTVEQVTEALARLQALTSPSSCNCSTNRPLKTAPSCQNRIGNPNWYVRNQNIIGKDSDDYGYRWTTLDMARHQLANNNIASITLGRVRAGRRLLDFHEVVLVGMDWNEKKRICEYKVRNSWGADCGKPAAGTEKWISSNNESCKNGYFNIDAKSLSESIVGMTALEDP